VIGWNATPEVETEPLEFSWPSSRLKFAADGRLLVIGLTNGSIHVFDAATLVRQAILEVWNMQTEQIEFTIQHDRQVTIVAYSSTCEQVPEAGSEVEIPDR
jgi:hypothetical protein